VPLGNVTRLSQAPAARQRGHRAINRGVRAPQPGFYDELVRVDSTTVECARSLDTTRRSQLGDTADYGYCATAAVSSYTA
jgi:hypothetical protein